MCSSDLQAIVQKLNAVVVKGMQAPAVEKHFLQNGLEPATSTPTAFRELIAADLQSWRKIIQDSKINVTSK